MIPSRNIRNVKVLYLYIKKSSVSPVEHYV